MPVAAVAASRRSFAVWSGTLTSLNAMTSGFSAAISPLISGCRSLQRLWSCSRLSVATRNCIGLLGSSSRIAGGPRRDATGLSPDPAVTREGVTQVFATPAVSWRGIFAVHTWIAVRPTGASASALRLQRQEMLHDLPAGGAPDAGMRADVLKRRIESTNPMRLAGHEGMDRDSHHAGDCSALAVERVELTPQHRLEFRHGRLHLEIGRHIVGLNRIRQRHQGRVADVEYIRLIIIDPVTDIADAGLGEVIERVPGLGQAGAEPADRALAGRRLDAVDRRPHRLALLRGI